MSIIPGSFPTSSHHDNEDDVIPIRSISRDLYMNSLHTKKLRWKKFSKECFKFFDLILITQILIIHFIDNSIINLLLRYSLQYFLLNLNNILDDLLVMNQQTYTTNEEEVNARDSLNALINSLKMKYKTSLISGIILFNAFCIWSHFYMVETSKNDEYLYGFCFLNLIGQLKLHHKYPIMVLDVFIFCQQILLYNFKFNNILTSEHSQDQNNNNNNTTRDVEDEEEDEDDKDEDGYQGNLKIYEVNILPKLNKNFLIEYIGWDRGIRLGNDDSTYGSV